MKGLANIPILIALALIIGITPFAIKQVQENQNLQNRAATGLFTGNTSVPCTDLYVAKNRYCSTALVVNPEKTIPCVELNNAITTYCQSKAITSVPTRSPFPTSATKPTPTSVADKTFCVSGQLKCVGRMVFRCAANSWSYLRVCPNTCSGNGICR